MSRFTQVPDIGKIFNHCIRKGTYPKSLKCAQVVPIHKGGQKDLCNNYRPISLLSPIKKIFEKLLHSRLYSFIEQHNMLSTNQSGFRSGLSTSLPVYDIHENFLQNKEKGLTAWSVFCDLSKAFDTLDHEILLWKLEHFYGIRGFPHKLLTSYLQDRQQYTVVGGYRSTTRGVTLGVPQGSSLRPLLFALYVNDLLQESNLTPTLFVDDTLLTISCANSVNLQYGVNSELQKVDEWMRCNKLSINYSKPHICLSIATQINLVILK